MSSLDDEPVRGDVDTSDWDDAMFLRSEALLKYELEIEDPDREFPVDYER